MTTTLAAILEDKGYELLGAEHARIWSKYESEYNSYLSTVIDHRLTDGSYVSEHIHISEVHANSVHLGGTLTLRAPETYGELYLTNSAIVDGRNYGPYTALMTTDAATLSLPVEDSCIDYMYLQVSHLMDWSLINQDEEARTSIFLAHSYVSGLRGQNAYRIVLDRSALVDVELTASHFELDEGSRIEKARIIGAHKVTAQDFFLYDDFKSPAIYGASITTSKAIKGSDGKKRRALVTVSKDRESMMVSIGTYKGTLDTFVTMLESDGSAWRFEEDLRDASKAKVAKARKRYATWLRKAARDLEKDLKAVVTGAVGR